MNEAVKQLTELIEENQRRIQSARGRKDYKLASQLLNTQAKLLQLISPFIKRRREPEKGYPNLKRAIESLQIPIVEEILRALEKD